MKVKSLSQRSRGLPNILALMAHVARQQVDDSGGITGDGIPDIKTFPRCVTRECVGGNQMILACLASFPFALFAAWLTFWC